MKKQPGKWILTGMFLMCLVFIIPQLLGVNNRYDSSSMRSFMIFGAYLLFQILLALFAFDWAKKLDGKWRNAAGSSYLTAAGFALVSITGLVLIFAMIHWNDERSNLAAAGYFWDHGPVEYFRNYANINKWLGRHHPPLLVLFYAMWYKLTGFSMMAGRLVNLTFAIGAAWLAYRWVKKAADEAIASLMLICLVMTPMWCFSSASALLDMPFLFLFMASMLFFEKYIQERKASFAAAAGALAALTILSRYNGIFLFAIWFVQLVIDRETRSLLKVKSTWLVVIVPFVLGLPWMILSIVQGTFFVQISRLSEFILVAFIRPGGWWYLTEVLLPLAPIMMGVYLVPLQLYGLASSFKTGAPGVKRIVAAGITYLFMIAITLPNPRYMIPAIPMLAAIASIGLWRLAASGKGMTAVLAANLGCTLGFVVFYTYMTSEKMIYIFY